MAEDTERRPADDGRRYDGGGTDGTNRTSPTDPSARPLAISTAPRAKTHAWTLGESLTWAEVAAWVTDPRAGDKDGAGYVLGQLSPCGCGKPKKQHADRTAASVQSRGVLALDADHLSPDERDGLPVRLRALGWMVAVYSTASTTAAAPRLRILILLDRDVQPDEYHRLADVVMGDLGVKLFDPGSVQPSRFMYMPTLPADPADYEQHVIDGAPLDTEAQLARWNPVQVARAHPSAKSDPRAVSGLVGTFNREYSIEEVIEAYALPYVAGEGDRLRYEPATSEAGAVLLDDHLLYSHHITDPAFGQVHGACSAFDLVRLHRFGDKDAKAGDKPVQERPSHRAMLALAREDRRVAQREASETFETPAVETVDLGAAITLDQCHAVFRRWLGSTYDLGALDAVLAVAAVERLDGDPLWLLVVAGSGNAKTETVQALAGVGAEAVSTISSPGALLSATSKRDRTADATGGLLRSLQPRGLLVVKDVTSILSMSRDARAEVLAALRDVYDGRWDRAVGSDGGRKLSWAGRIGLAGAVTTKWDTAHSVIAAMGDRFVLVRTDSRLDRVAAARQTLGNTGSEVQMRAELAAAAGGVIAGLGAAPAGLSDAEVVRLVDAANLVTWARTAVEMDYRGEVSTAHDPEAATRLARQLQQVFRGMVALGATRNDAMNLAIRCARDTMPPQRLRIIEYLAEHPDSAAGQVARGLDEPYTSISRQVDALHALRLLRADRRDAVRDFADRRSGAPDTAWRFTLADDVDPASIALGDPLHDGCRSEAALTADLEMVL